MASLESVLSNMSADNYLRDPIQFYVDENFRTISVPSKGVVLGVVGDKNVNRVNFKMVRTYNGIDLSTFTTRINYVPTSGTANYYSVNDMVIGDDYILFSWLVGPDVTYSAGNVTFTVRMIKTQNNVITQEFNSSPASGKVLSGISAESSVTPSQQSDIIANIKSEMDTYVNSRVSAAVTGSVVQSAVDTYLANNTAGVATLTALNTKANKQKYGKSVWIADSVGHGWDNSYYSYIDIASESGLFQTVTKFAQGAATLGPYNSETIANGKSAIEQINNNPDAIRNASVVFLQFGANDAQSIMKNLISVGTPNDSENTVSVCGYAKKVIKRIYQLNESIHIVFLNLTETDNMIEFVAERYKVYMTANNVQFDKAAMKTALSQWNEQVIQVFRNYNIQVINILDDSGLNGHTKEQWFAPDKLHPNTKGHTLIFRKIENTILTQTAKIVQIIQSSQYAPFIVNATPNANFTGATLNHTGLEMVAAIEGGKDVKVILPMYIQGISQATLYLVGTVTSYLESGWLEVFFNNIKITVGNTEYIIAGRAECNASGNLFSVKWFNLTGLECQLSSIIGG